MDRRELTELLHGHKQDREVMVRFPVRACARCCVGGLTVALNWPRDNVLCETIWTQK